MTKINLPSADERLRVNMGWQCPECFGVNIDTPERHHFTCRDCGCQWDHHYYPSLVVQPPVDKIDVDYQEQHGEYVVYQMPARTYWWVKKPNDNEPISSHDKKKEALAAVKRYQQADRRRRRF